MRAKPAGVACTGLWDLSDGSADPSGSQKAAL